MPTRTAPARKPAVKWTAARKKAFLAELGATANVRAASRAAGVPDGSAYRLRDKDGEFRAAWGAALAEGYARVEMMLLERALKGTVKPVWHAGKKVGSVKEDSDRLALGLLTAHRGTVKGAGQPTRVENRKDIQHRLTTKLLGMGERMRGEAGQPVNDRYEVSGGEAGHGAIEGGGAGGGTQ